jgi:antitoxin component HigA of HigAB toxin-antitoxin module
MGEDGVIRIADFGISKMLADGERLSNAAGTPAFMSPELCSGAPSVSGQQADVWAIAAAMFMLRFGHPPFLAGSIVLLYNKIINEPLVLPHAIDPALQNLLEHMLEKDPEKRYTVDEVIRHPWLMQPPTTVVKSVSRRDNFGVWPPAPTYDKDERAAMDSPLKTANRDEMYSSIVDNTSTLVDKDPRRSGSEQKEEEIMTTNWGLDVFEHVDDGDFQSGSEDEVDSVDGEPGRKNDAKDSAPSNISSAQDVMATNGSKSDDVMSTLGSKTSVSSRHDMDSEEEQKRAQRFQKLGKAKVVQQVLPKEASAHHAGDWSDSDGDESTKKAAKKAEKKSSAPSIFDTNIDAKDIGVGAPSAPKVAASPAGRDRPPRLKVARGDSVDIDTDELIAENLTMDDFSSLMDTLSGPVNRSVPSTPNTSSPMVLGSFEITEMQRNPFNGVGMGFHSEQGVRPNQEDRCLVHPTLLAADAATKASKFEGDDAEFFKKVSVAAIFDGHSGTGCAEYLHERLISKLISAKDTFKSNLPALLRQTFSTFDDEVCRHLRAEDDVSGSTGLVMIYNGR